MTVLYFVLNEVSGEDDDCVILCSVIFKNDLLLFSFFIIFCEKGCAISLQY